MDTLAKLKVASILPDLIPMKVIDFSWGWGAVFMYSPHETYERWFTVAGGYETEDQLLDELVPILEDATMANIFKMTGDLFKYMTAEMIPNGGKDVVMTIKSVHVEELQNQRGKQNRPVIFFNETDKGFVLGNKTNVRQMVKLFGSETDDWVGSRVALYRDEIQAFGSLQSVIRIRDYHPKTKQPKQQTKQEPINFGGPLEPQAELFDEEE